MKIFIKQCILLPGIHEKFNTHQLASPLFYDKIDKHAPSSFYEHIGYK